MSLIQFTRNHTDHSTDKSASRRRSPISGSARSARNGCAVLSDAAVGFQWRLADIDDVEFLESTVS